MTMRAVLIGLLALAWSSAAAAQVACPPAPPLAPEPAPPKGQASKSAYNRAVKAYDAWAAPRIAYGACQRELLAQQTKRLNALGGEINTLVDDISAVSARLAEAREARAAALRAYAMRRKREAPVAAREGRAAPAPPCAPPPAHAAPVFANGEEASASEMRRADLAFLAWAAPLEDYVACRRAERVAMVGQHDALKRELAVSQAGYQSYRKVFNAAVVRFQTASTAYAARLPERRAERR